MRKGGFISPSKFKSSVYHGWEGTAVGGCGHCFHGVHSREAEMNVSAQLSFFLILAEAQLYRVMPPTFRLGLPHQLNLTGRRCIDTPDTPAVCFRVDSMSSQVDHEDSPSQVPRDNGNDNH